MIKILYITDSLRSGGKERQLVECVKYLVSQNNYKIEIIVMSEEIHYDDIYATGVKVHKIIRNTRWDLKIMPAFIKIFDDFQPDIIHTWNSMCNFYASWWIILNKAKLVDGSIRNANALFSFKEKIMMKFGFILSKKIIANSQAGLISYRPPRKKSVFIHNGIDLKSVDRAVSETKYLDFRITTRFCIGMVATYSIKKDYKTFISAANIVLKKRNDVTFIAIGDGVDHLGKDIDIIYPDHIKLLAKRRDILNVMNFFDIGVLATSVEQHHEGIPNVIMEYMALHKPVIATDCGGVNEIVRDRYNGFLVEPCNPEIIANIILTLLDNEAYRKILGENGYNTIQNEFTIEIMGKRLENLYASII